MVKADVLFSLPTLKTHRKAGITVSLKNLVGINVDKNWLSQRTEGYREAGRDEHSTSGKHRLSGSCRARLTGSVFRTKELVRPFMHPLDPRRLYGTRESWIDFMWPLAHVIRKMPKGHSINWRLLFPDYRFSVCRGERVKEWAYVHTFDMLAPRYTGQSVSNRLALGE